MKNSKHNAITKVIVAISFLLMVIVNALANLLPINGMTTGQVSDSYKNLFAPAGITFSIWGLIYLMLLGYTIYQFGFFQKDNTDARNNLFRKVGFYFIISSLANTAWIFAWHYKVIWLTILLMLIILICLIAIIDEISKEKLSFRDEIFIRLPFSIYFGWITIATIANVTTFLVSLNWNGFGFSEQFWAVIIIFVGLVIGGLTMLRYSDIAYGLVIIWAYMGIVIKHISKKGFDMQYPAIITTALVCIGLLIILELYILVKQRKNKKRSLYDEKI